MLLSNKRGFSSSISSWPAITNEITLSNKRGISHFPKFAIIVVVIVAAVILVFLVSLVPTCMYHRPRRRTVKWKLNDLSKRQVEIDCNEHPSELNPQVSDSSIAPSNLTPNISSNVSLAEGSGEVCNVEVHISYDTEPSDRSYVSEHITERAPSSTIIAQSTIHSTGIAASSSSNTLTNNQDLQSIPEHSESQEIHQEFPHTHPVETTTTPAWNAEETLQNYSRVIPADLALRNPLQPQSRPSTPLRRRSGPSTSSVVTSPHSGLTMNPLSPGSFTYDRSNPSQSAATLALLQPTEDYEDDSNYFVFLGSTQVIVCDSKGGKYEVLEQGIAVRIPPNALDTEAHIEVGVAIHGSFKFPAGQQPISAIVWLLVRGTSTFTFKKPVEIQLPHFLNLSNSDIDEKAEEFGLGFMTTNEEMDRRQRLIFTEGPRESVVYLQRSAKVLMKHFCFVCLSAKDSVIYERSKYLLTQVLPDPIKTLQWDLHFCVSYNLESFAKV